MARLCMRSRCDRPAQVRLTYDTLACEVWFDPLPDRSGMFQEICEFHAKRLTLPMGWTLLDRRRVSQELFDLGALLGPLPNAGSAPPGLHGIGETDSTGGSRGGARNVPDAAVVAVDITDRVVGGVQHGDVPHSAGPHGAGLGGAGLGGAGPHSAGPHGAGLGGAGPHSAGPHSAGLDSPSQGSSPRRSVPTAHTRPRPGLARGRHPSLTPSEMYSSYSLFAPDGAEVLGAADALGGASTLGDAVAPGDPASVGTARVGVGRPVGPSVSDHEALVVGDESSAATLGVRGVRVDLDVVEYGDRSIERVIILPSGDSEDL